MIENINWYPGHMKKTRELIQQNLKAVDVVVEIIDARIPRSSRNPIIDELCSGKDRVIILGKGDLADPKSNEAWIARLKNDGTDDAGVERKKQGRVAAVIMMNSVTGEGSKELLQALDYMKKEKAERKNGRDSAASDGGCSGAGNRIKESRPLRIMVVGVPNVGKSSFINRMTGKRSTKVGNRPGVTKGKQWLTLKNGMQLLDTPGILWPKFEDPSVGLNLAFCGSIKDEILDNADLALELIRVLQKQYPEMLAQRYKLNELGEDPLENMEAIAARRGFIMSGGRIDYERTARTILDEFRAGKIGNITLERP